MKKISLLSLLLLFATESPAQYDDDRNTIKLSPQVRIIEREQTIPTIPRGLIQQFISQPKFINDDEIENAGYVIANANQSLLSTEGHKIYVSNLDEGTKGDQYIILRLGQTYRSPLEDEVLAQEAIYLGEAVLEIAGEPAMLNITKANREIKLGDRLLLKKQQAIFYEDFHPHSPTSLENAYIIAEANGTLVIGRYQVVIINKGLEDGIEVGHLLAVHKNSRKIIDRIVSEDEVTLQKQHAGTLLVYRVFDRISYALVMTSRLPISVFDQVSVP